MFLVASLKSSTFKRGEARQNKWYGARSRDLMKWGCGIHLIIVTVSLGSVDQRGPGHSPIRN